MGGGTNIDDVIDNNLGSHFETNVEASPYVLLELNSTYCIESVTIESGRC